MRQRKLGRVSLTVKAVTGSNPAWRNPFERVPYGMSRPATDPVVTPVTRHPVLIASHGDGLWLSSDGEIEHLPANKLLRLAQKHPPLICHARSTSTRLGGKAFACFDVLELFGFAFPAKFVVPTASGLARFIDCKLPKSLEDEADVLLQTVAHCLDELSMETGAAAVRARQIAWAMARSGWNWAPTVLRALGETSDEPHTANQVAGLRVWTALPDWSDHAPEGQPGSESVSSAEARTRLTVLIGRSAEDTPQQAAYTSDVPAPFQTRDQVGIPDRVLAEAGPADGSTLAPIPPAPARAGEPRPRRRCIPSQ